MKSILKKSKIFFENNYYKYFQSFDTSLKSHDSGYSRSGAIKQAKDVISDRISNNFANSREFNIDAILKENPQLNKLAVDIGSGVGWMSKFLSTKFEKVLAIEPSQSASNISKKLIVNDNIRFINDYAEKTLNELSPSKDPVFYVTGRVLTHLGDKQTIAIINAINKHSCSGSVFSLAEVWGEENFHQRIWHIRTKKWWKHYFGSSWIIDFQNNPIQAKGRFVGMIGKKI